MDIQSTMSMLGFGHREARHIIIDRDGELWLAAAPETVGGFLAVGGGLPGTLRIEPLEGGERVPYTYAVTESLLELTTEKGTKVKFAIDKDVQAIRITGKGAFRLNAVQAMAGTSSLILPEGLILRSPSMRYLFTAKKGKITCDDSFVLHKRQTVMAVIDVEPENNEFELCVFDRVLETEVPVVTKTLEECAAENSAAFQAFVDSLLDLPDEWKGVKAKLAYPIWLCHRILDGREVIVENKYSSRNTNAKLMAIASLAFKDAAKAIDMILSCPVDLPPVAAIAVERLFEDNLLNDSRGDIFRVYAALDAIARKCISERSVDGEGLSFYAYRFESGEEKSPAFFRAGEPVLAPDLNAYLVIAGEYLGKLAHLEYDVAAGRKWEAYAKALKPKLIAELWNGEDFIGKNAYSGEVSGPDKLLSLVPAVLGSRLPAEIIGKLAEKIDQETAASAIGLLIVRGLCLAGEKEAAQAIARHALNEMRTGKATCPFYSAALIALAHQAL